MRLYLEGKQWICCVLAKLRVYCIFTLEYCSICLFGNLHFLNINYTFIYIKKRHSTLFPVLIKDVEGSD